MKHTPFILLLLSCCLLWGCQSQDTQNTSPSSKSEAAHQLDQPVPTAKPTRPTDWPMFMYDLYFSGKSPDPALKPPLKVRWKFKTGGPILGNPAVAYDTVYVGSNDQKLYALDVKKWRIKWTFKAGGAIRYAPTVWNRRVYFSARDNRVYALDAETGDQIWQFQSETWMDSPPIISNGRLYIGAFTRKIHVIDARTGQLVAQPQGRVLINGMEYGCVQGALRPITPGHQVNLWRGYIPEKPYTNSYPVIANGVVYIGARDNKIHALDLESKAEIWSYETKGFIDAAPAIADGTLYVTSHDGYVYAFENQPSDAPQAQSDKRPIGIVAHDDVPVYTDRDGDSIVKLNEAKSQESELRLNDGVELPIVSQAASRYQVELPNGEIGWMDRFGFGVFEETKGIQFSKAICSNIRTLNLIEGGESPHWSPDGRFIAFLKRTDLSGQYWKASELWITDSYTREFRNLCEGNFYNPHLSWSLDSNFIAFEAYEGDNSYVWIINRQSPRLIQIVRGDAPSWSPIANQIAFRRWEEGVDILYRINIDKTGLTLIVRIPIEGRVGAFSYMDPPAWSRDGRRIAIGLDGQHYQSGHSRIRVHDIDGTKLKEIPTQSKYVQRMGWSADSSQLAYVLSGNPKPDNLLDRQLHIVSLEAANQTKILKHTLPSWSPEGNRLAYVEREDCMGVRWKVWVLDLETNRATPIARTTIDLTALTWLPDGNRLCLWYTSSYLRDGAYKPAETKGWVVEIAQ